MRPAAATLCAALACGIALGGCARFPAGSTQANGAQVVVSMTVAGQINPSDYYFVVFNNANNANGSSGPVPVIAPPWGNGFVSGAATQFVEYTGSNPGDGYVVQAFVPGTAQLQPGAVLAAPVQDTPVSNGSSTLQFRIPLSELATNAVPAASITTLQINFINTDRLPVNPDDTTPKQLDSLGNTVGGQLNRYITINAQRAGTYSNSTAGSIEPQGDVALTNGSGGLLPDSNADAPNLDIVNWSVQITQ